MSLSHRERRSAGPDRRGEAGGRARDGAGGAPGAFRGRGASESAAKAPRDGIGGEKKRGISTIIFRCFSGAGVFVADLDDPRRCGPPGGAPRGGRRPRRAPPGAETCTSHSKVQFQPLFSSAKCTSRRRSGPAAVVADRGASPAPGHSQPVRKAQLCRWVFLWLVGAGSVMGVMVPVGGVPPCRGFLFFCRAVSRRARRCLAHPMPPRTTARTGPPTLTPSPHRACGAARSPTKSMNPRPSRPPLHTPPPPAPPTRRTTTGRTADPTNQKTTPNRRPCRGM